MPGCETCQWHGPPEPWMERTFSWSALNLHRALHHLLYALMEPILNLMKGKP